MILINKTISFADSSEQEGIRWIKNTYVPLLNACNDIELAQFFKIETLPDVDKCYALQLRFSHSENYLHFCEKYQSDFMQAILLKFSGNIAMFETILEEL